MYLMYASIGFVVNSLLAFSTDLPEYKLTLIFCFCLLRRYTFRIYLTDKSKTIACPSLTPVVKMGQNHH